MSDEVWAQLSEAIERAKHSRAGAPGKQGEREFIEALLCLIRVGAPWRDLPADLGYWHAVYMRFRRWEARGIWRRLWSQLAADQFAQARELFVDSTTIRAHHHAAGAPKKTVQIRLWDALGVD